MEFLEGDNLVDGIQELGERAARRRGVSFEQLVEETKASFDRDGYPAPYAGPGPVAMELYRRLDAARCFFGNALAAAGLGPRREPMLGGLNPARVMQTLCAVHGHELLVDGVFNGESPRWTIVQTLFQATPTRATSCCWATAPWAASTTAR